MIIRDTDLMQPYEEDAALLKNQYDGLHTEIERGSLFDLLQILL